MSQEFAVIVDAGSSGSRVYVYSWHENSTEKPAKDCLPKIEHDPEWVLKVPQGISSFAGKESSIWNDHLSQLVAKAEAIVPAEKRPETPFYFLATAGLRLLPEADQASILKTVCSNIQEKTRFLLPECESHVSVIDGQAEGLYGWLALNYLIHNRNDGLWTDDEFLNTYGFMDMGGASAQIAFVPNATEAEKHSEDLHKITLRTMAGKPITWKIFVNTWLGFGANQAQKRWRDLLISDMKPEQLEPMKSNSPIPIIDPCLPARATEYTDISVPQADNAKAELLLYGEGAFAKCIKQLRPMLNDHMPCKDEPCLFNGVHVPAFDFANQKFVGISEYWYTAQDLFKFDGKFDYATFTKRATEFCDSSWDDINERFKKHEFGGMSEMNIKQSCFKSAWVLTILQDGFKFPLSPNNPNAHHNFLDTFQSTAKVDDFELSWCLGKAVLYASSRVPAAENTEDFVGIESFNGDRILGGDARPQGNAQAQQPLSGSTNSSMNTMPVMFIAALFVAFTLYLVLKPHKRKIILSELKSLRSKVFSRFGYKRLESIGELDTRQSISRATSPNANPYIIPLAEYHVGTSTSTYPPPGLPSRVGSRININEEWV